MIIRIKYFECTLILQINKLNRAISTEQSPFKFWNIHAWGFRALALLIIVMKISDTHANRFWFKALYMHRWTDKADLWVLMQSVVYMQNHWIDSGLRPITRS